MDTKLAKPLIYLDRETLKNDRYLFISYSHKDDTQVFEILEKSFSLGANYWYDVEMRDGEDWEKRAVKALNDKDCAGAVVFLSKSSAVSGAVMKEIGHINKLFGDKSNVLPIFLDATSLEGFIKVVQNGIADVNDNFNFLVNNLPVINTLLRYEQQMGAKRLFLSYESSDDIARAVFKFAQDNDATEAQNFSLRNSKIIKHGIDHVNGSYYIKIGKYKSLPITWRLIKKEGSLLYFVSESVLDYAGADAIGKLLSSVRDSASGTEYVEEISLIKQRLFNACREVIGPFPSNDKAEARRAQALRLFVLEKDDTTFTYVNGLGYEVNQGFDLESINLGVRLQMIINDDKIKE